MQFRTIVLFFVVAVTAGWLISGFGSPPQAISSLDSPPADTSASEPLYAEELAEEEGPGEDWNAGEVILDRSEDGHFYADVEVDGEVLNFLVDTGATAVALTATDAEALGLVWDDQDLQLVGRGVSGDVFGKMVMLENMQIGGLSAQRVPAAIIPTGLDRSLLGQAFLKQIDNVSISGDRMVLK
jgi:aspartyl protease family protein